MHRPWVLAWRLKQPGTGEGERGGEMCFIKNFHSDRSGARNFSSCAIDIGMQNQPLQQKTEPAVAHAVGRIISAFPI